MPLFLDVKTDGESLNLVKSYSFNHFKLIKIIFHVRYVFSPVACVDPGGGGGGGGGAEEHVTCDFPGGLGFDSGISNWALTWKIQCKCWTPSGTLKNYCNL